MKSHEPAAQLTAHQNGYLGWRGKTQSAAMKAGTLPKPKPPVGEIIAEYIKIHERKGTPSVIRQLFKDLGYGDIEIIENYGSLYWDGTAYFDGTFVFGGQEGDWAEYKIKLSRPITNSEAEKIKKWLEQIAPLRCRLVEMDYRRNAIYWDGEIEFNGEYNFGAA